MEDDRLFAHAEGLGRRNVLLLALREDLRADQMADARPGQNAEDDHDEVHSLLDGDARADDRGKDLLLSIARQEADRAKDTVISSNSKAV